MWRIPLLFPLSAGLAALLLAFLVAHPALASGPVVSWGWAAAPPSSVDGTTGTAAAIAAGSYHSCAIQAGTDAVVCWGADGSGQATPPPSVDGTTGTATAIAAGEDHSCAIQAGTDAVVCWGGDDSGQATPPPSVDGTTGTATAIAVGGGTYCVIGEGSCGWGPCLTCEDYGHSCAIQAETSAIVCWGSNSSGYPAEYVGQATPPPSVDGTTGTAIAAGSYHSCAIQAGTDAVVCWGGDDSGQATPPPLVDGTAGTAMAIAAGASHSCAIQAGTDAVVCWGSDWIGLPPPPSVDGTTGTATAIAAGASHSCAIQADTDAVVCWGSTETPPPSVDGTTGTATALAASSSYTLAIRTPACGDGLDNNGDGLTDYPDDPLCSDGDDLAEWPDCSDGLDNDGDGSIDFPTDRGCDDLLDYSEAPVPMQAEVKLKIGLKFKKPKPPRCHDGPSCLAAFGAAAWGWNPDPLQDDKIQVQVKDWQLPAGVVPTDVTVNVGGAEFTRTLNAKGKYRSPDGNELILLKQSKKTQLWKLTVKWVKNSLAANFADEGLTNADNPKPGLVVTVPLIINVGGVAYGWDVDLIYKSKHGKKGTAK